MQRITKGIVLCAVASGLALSGGGGSGKPTATLGQDGRRFCSARTSESKRL
jgi:hypothetical protein